MNPQPFPRASSGLDLPFAAPVAVTNQSGYRPHPGNSGIWGPCMALKGSRTEQYLSTAFAAESMAARRLRYFAMRADMEGFSDLAALFRSTADGASGYAQGLLEHLEAIGDPATGLPFGPTAQNLAAALASEARAAGPDGYMGMARTARAEGFGELADWFETLARAKTAQAKRLEMALQALQG